MCIGDSIGSSCETFPREVLKKDPITDMIGKGKFHLQPGQFTDDSTMALCMAESLLIHHDLVPLDHTERFHDWYLNGHLSSNGKVTDSFILIF